MQQPLTELPRTEQPSLLTCCQLLEKQWDSSLGSPSSVDLRLSILESRSSSKYSRIDLTKTNEAYEKMKKSTLRLLYVFTNGLFI